MSFLFGSPISFGVGTGSRLWPISFCFPFVMVFPRVLTRSIDIKLGVFPEGTSISDTAKALRDFFAEEAQFAVVAIQQCPSRIARVTFEEGGEAAKRVFEDQGSIRICGVACEVISPAPPVEKVLVYNFPYENNDAPVRKVLSDYGEVKDISYQTWVGLPGIHTGTRVVNMVRSSSIPRSLVIAGVRCKIWHRGQPVICDACREAGHVSAKCPNKGRCFHCRQQGHMARDCPDRPVGRGAWGLPSKSVSWVSGPDGSADGGSPVVGAHRSESVSVVEVEAHCAGSVSVLGVDPSGQTPSSSAPPSSDGGASSSSSEEGVPDCRGSPSVVSGVASCSNVSSVASVCNSNVLDENGLLIDKVSNGNSTNVMNSAIGNVSGDSPISNVSNVVSNTDNTNSSASDGPDSGVPLVGLTDGVPSVSPPSSGDSEMTSLPAVRKRSAPKSPPEDPLPPPGLVRRPVAKVGKSKIPKKNPSGDGHHNLPASVYVAAEMASSRGRPPH